MVKDKQLKNMVILGVVLITLLELYYAYKITIEYKGIYHIARFAILSLFQPFLYANLLGKEIINFKIKITILISISILLPLLVYSTLPNYTYDEGKGIVSQSLKENKDAIFAELSFNDKKIPVMNNPKQIFVADRVYYYKIISDNIEEYFIVNPLTGETNQLLEDYWRSGQ
ncbi:MAG: hypothetical protein GX781_09735 [Clostridiales bacterium]|nr:hypothetical protein [Clostridiales bacterium]